MLKNKFFCGCLSTNNSVSNLSVCFVCTLIAIFNTPILARCTPNAIIITLMFLVVLLNIKLILNLPKFEKVTLALLAIYMCVVTTYKVLGISSAELYYLFNAVQFFFFMWVGLCFYNNLSKKQIQIIVSIIIISMLATMVHNVFLYLQYGARDYIFLFRENKYATNSIATPFSSALLVLIGTLVVFGLNTPVKWSKHSAFILSVFSFVFLVLITQRVIAIGLAVILVFSIAFIEIKNCCKLSLKTKDKLWAFFVIVLLIVIIITNYEAILNFVSDVLGSKRISKRILQIIRFLKTGDIQEAGGSLTVRYNLIMTSLKTFFGSAIHFLFGVGDHRANNSIIGNHSQIIDEFARYGVLFASAIFWSVCRHFKTIRTHIGCQSKTKLNKQLTVVLIIFVIRALVGSVFYADIGIQLFLMLPLTLKLLNIFNQEKQNNNLKTPVSEGDLE